SLPRASGLRASTPPSTCSIVFRPLLLLLPLHTTLFSVPLLASTTFGSSGVRVTLTPPPLLLPSWRPARLVVCYLVTPLTTRGTDALTSPLPPSLDPELESLFPTDPVVQPPFPVRPFPAGFPGTPAPFSVIPAVPSAAPVHAVVPHAVPGPPVMPRKDPVS